MIPGILESLPESPLPIQEEQKIGVKLSKMGKRAREKALEKLVLHSMREAFFYARRCCRSNLPADEIYSLCYSALCRAAGNFKPRRIRFFAYAKVFIRGEISREWKKKSLVKNVPVEKISSTEISFDLNRANDSVLAKEHASHGNPGGQKDTELVPTCEPEFSSIHARELWEVLEPLLESKLTPSERTVIFMRYKQELNFREISVLLGTTKQWAQVLHAEALSKLREAMTRNKKVL